MCVCVRVMAALEHDLLEVMSSLLMSASSHMEVCVCVCVLCVCVLWLP